jgi:hypothetical protein
MMNLALTSKKMEGIEIFLKTICSPPQTISEIIAEIIFMDGSKREKGPRVMSILIALVLVSLVIPVISGAATGVTPQITPFITYSDIVVTNGSLTNHAFPSGYQVTPTLLKVQVELPETALPAPKGEMAGGPRSIGFSADPVYLVIIILVVAAAAAGIGYFLKRKRDDEEQE